MCRAVDAALAEFWGNPSSVHRFGQEARAAVERARGQVAGLIGARARDLLFTSSGTEAIDLGVRGVLGALPLAARSIATSKVEHNAVRDLAEDLEKRGEARVVWLPLMDDRSGRIDVAKSREVLKARPVALISVQWANNETGVIQPVEEIGKLAKEIGAIFHCDATQWVGKMPADFLTDASGECAAPFDIATFSAHKFHGPKGVGVLWSKRGVRMMPQIHGTQELGRRGGTENVPGICGAGVAAEEAAEFVKDGAAIRRLEKLRDGFEAKIVDAVAGVVTPPVGVPRLWNTSNIAFATLEAEALLLLLSERGVCASAGAACSSGSLEPSPVLLAMGVEPVLAHGAVRFSLSRDTGEKELETAAEIVIACVKQLRASSEHAIG